MVIDLSRQSPPEATLVVRNGLAAQQWEASLLEAPISGGSRAWRAPQLRTYRNWVGELWSKTPHRGAAEVLITQAQSHVLWRQVIGESREGRQLIGHDGPAALAAKAWRSLLAWDIDPSALKAGPGQADFDTFLRWCLSYRGRLRDANWVDEAETDRRLLDSDFTSPESIVLVDQHELAPVQQKLMARLRESGWDVRHEKPPEYRARCRRIELADEDDELRCAAEWGRQYLGTSPSRRVALVVADLGARRASVDRSLEHALGPDGFADPGGSVPVVLASGRQLLQMPAINAAFCGVALLSPRGTFETLSRWLRSPYFHGADWARRSEAALLETRLRSQLLAQIGFLQAYRHAGLARTMRRDTPQLADRLDSALGEIPLRTRLTPTGWSAAWQRSLAKLGWTDAIDEEAVQTWERALAELAQLTPILGAIPIVAALEEFERILGRAQPPDPLSLHGLHVFEHVDDIGPGYDHAWITGVNDSRWPELARDNPLLPRRLQTRHRMPWCDPLDALGRSELSLKRLMTRVPEIIFSSPRREQDQRSAPSALIDGMELAELGELRVGRNDVHRHLARRRIERVADPVPPLKGSTIVGGAQTLNLQAKCPLLAFCASRLAARPLEPVGRGLSAGLQGIVAHRAAELLFEASVAPDALLARLHQSAERALDEAFGATRSALNPLFELELDRVTTLLGKLVEAESHRAEFSVVHLEERREIRIESWRLRTRIDRVDELSDGTLAVLDYKTGQGVRRPDWFADRLGDTQLPLYTLELGERVSAAVIVALREPQVTYRGIWCDRDAFPGSSAKLPDERSWEAQLGIWSEQLAVLAREYAGGDTRLFETGIDAVKKSYAPLSRIYEILASWRDHT